MNTNPLISIITPCHNAENTISDTIESVLDQTYTNWEMIIVDDCSSDKSSEIIHKYSNIDKRIKYYKTNGNSGSPSIPRNIGIEKSKGQFIAFLDADDIWLQEKLQIQIKFMLINNAKLSYSYYEKMTWNGLRHNRIVKTRVKTNYNSLLKSNSIPCLTSMVSREAIGDTRFKQIPQEDFCFWLDILKKGYIAHNVCEVTSVYRIAKNSRSSNKLDMFKGYWNVIRNYQNTPFFKCLYYMTTYTILGVIKHIK